MKHYQKVDLLLGLTRAQESIRVTRSILDHARNDLAMVELLRAWGDVNNAVELLRAEVRGARPKRG